MQRNSTHRGNLIGRALHVIDWLYQRNREFTAADFVKGLGLGMSTAYVWLAELEQQGLITYRTERKGLGPRAYTKGKDSFQSHIRIYTPTPTRRR